MAIVKMSKFNLFAFNSDRENLLHELQKFKYVHFINLNKNDSLKEIGLKNVEVLKLNMALKYYLTFMKKNQVLEL